MWEQTTGERGSWLIPRFLDLSADYDGVHVTTRGYLETAGRAPRIDEVWVTVLAGWAPDETYWPLATLNVKDFEDFVEYESLP